ncbi:BTB/POZ domain-containing protein 6-A-like [Centruroides vittatus]|uniref:BTB/POZ domain-containing protein 6-A-like n=1 Tax=Centruroides vittatus TaxID=120091 RepID=UPI00350F4D18
MDMKSLYCDEASSDVTILCNSSGYKKTFLAHSVVLYSCSKIFKQVLNERKEIDMSSNQIYTVTQLLRHIYLGKVTIRDWKQALDLLDLCNRYNILNLSKKCLLYLQKSLRLDNILPIFDYACLNKEKDLQAKCLLYIKFYAIILLYFEDFVHLDMKSVIAIASLDQLNIRSETDLFWAAWKWGKERCVKEGLCCKSKNVIQQIHPILPFIRFNQINEREKNDLPKFIARMSEHQQELYEKRQTDVTNPDILAMNQFGLEITLDGSFDYRKVATLDKELHMMVFSTDKSGFILGFKLRLCGENFRDSGFCLKLVSVNNQEVVLKEFYEIVDGKTMHVDERTKTVELIVALKKLVYVVSDEPYELILNGNKNTIWLPTMKDLNKSLDINGCLHFSFYSNVIGIQTMYYTEVDDSPLIFSFHS